MKIKVKPIKKKVIKTREDLLKIIDKIDSHVYCIAKDKNGKIITPYLYTVDYYEEEEWWKHYRQFFEYKNRYFCIEWLLGIPRFSHYDNQPYEVYLEVKKIKTKIETIQEKTIFEFKDIEGKDIDMETTNKVIKYKCDIL